MPLSLSPHDDPVCIAIALGLGKSNKHSCPRLALIVLRMAQRLGIL
jgi:hypothetical protein